MAISAAAAEAERRRMTQSVAEQGSRGYETQAVTVQPSEDMVTAAKASILASPVDMSDGQQAALAAGTEGVAASSDKYADAQREIFRGGQESMLGYENEAYDKFGTYADAQNYQLNRYRTKLAEDEEARGSGSGGGLPVDPENNPMTGAGGAYDYLSSIPEIAEFGANHSFINPELWSGGSDDKDITSKAGRFVGPNGSFTMEPTVDEMVGAMADEDGPMASYLEPDFVYGAQWDAMMGDGGGYAASIVQSGIPSNEFPYHVTEALVADGVPRTHARVMAAQIAMAYVPVYQSVEPDYVPQTYESTYSRPTTTTAESMWSGGRWDAQTRNDEARRVSAASARRAEASNMSSSSSDAGPGVVPSDPGLPSGHAPNDPRGH